MGVLSNRHISQSFFVIGQSMSFIERVHTTIKRIAARSVCSVLVSAHWYNSSPNHRVDCQSVPFEQILSYKPRCLGDLPSSPPDSSFVDYAEGMRVFVKPPNSRCTSEWHEGLETQDQRGLTVEVNGTPRHVSDLRHVPWSYSSTLTPCLLNLTLLPFLSLLSHRKHLL